MTFLFFISDFTSKYNSTHFSTVAKRRTFSSCTTETLARTASVSLFRVDEGDVGALVDDGLETGIG